MADRGLALVAVVALALLLGCPTASADVTSGSLRAAVVPDPWHLSIADAGGSVLSENRGLDSGPTGTLGFSAASGWFHATRVASGGMEGAAYVAQLETTDPTRGLQLRIEPDRDGVIALDASVMGPSAGVTAMGIGFDSRPG